MWQKLCIKLSEGCSSIVKYLPRMWEISGSNPGQSDFQESAGVQPSNLKYCLSTLTKAISMISTWFLIVHLEKMYTSGKDTLTYAADTLTRGNGVIGLINLVYLTLAWSTVQGSQKCCLCFIYSKLWERFTDHQKVYL